MKLEDYYTTLGDLLHILKKKSRVICAASLLFSSLAVGYVLLRPSVYEATAQFRELGKQESGGGVSITSMLLGGSGKNFGSQAVSAMNSRTILRQVAQDLSLQAVLTRAKTAPGLIHHLLDQIKVEWAHYKGWEAVSTHCPDCAIHVAEIDYDGDQSLPLSIEFDSAHRYVVKTPHGGIGEGCLGHPFRTEHFSFTLEGEREDDSGVYSMVLLPLEKVVDSLQGGVNIELDEDDPTLVVLEYAHPDKRQALAVLNRIMAFYQKHLEKEQRRFAEIQIAYLKKRQEEMFSNQTKVMKKHARMLSRDLSASGFVNFEKEMEFLFQNRLGCLEKIHTFDLKLQRLGTLLQDPKSCQGQIFTHEELSSVSPVLEELTRLKMLRDSLSLALTRSRSPIKNNLSEEMVTLSQVTRYMDEAERFVRNLREGRPLDENLALAQDDGYQVGEWVQKLQDPSLKPAERECQQRAFLSYIVNLQRLLEMQRRIAQERLTYQCPGQPEFQGIDLETAGQLQLGYLKESHQFEAQFREAGFILQQLDNPEFEINSLSATLTDPISQEIIQKSSGLALQLRDQKYHSPKEQERTREALETQKRFLQAHLKQTMDVQILHNDLLEDRIRALQGKMLELVQEKISVLEKHIHDFIEAQIVSLRQQKELALDTMNEINQNMASLPDKWLSEQLMKQNVNLNKAIVEELTRLVENKNISHNLELIQSAPLDSAWTKTLPKRPRLVLMAIIGASLGAFFSSAYVILRQLDKGVLATPDNLRSFDQTVLGAFDPEFMNPPSDNDLEVLRALTSWMERQPGRVLLAVKSFYAPSLAKLLSKREEKVIILNRLSSERGLLQFLEGSFKDPEIQHRSDYDELVSGGASRYLPELVHTPKFRRLLDRLKEEYDRVILVCEAPPASSEVLLLTAIADMCAITLEDESLPEIKHYFDESKPVAFMFRFG